MSSVLGSILAKDLDGLRNALDNGDSANVTGMNGLHALHYAAMLNRFDMFKVLVEHGADVHAVDFHNNTTLYFAARHMGSAEFVQYVIDTEVNIDAQNKIGQTASIIATRLGNTEGLQTLLQNGANPNLQNIEGKSALHDAVNTNHSNEALLLVEYGANIQLNDNHNRTPESLANQSQNAVLKLVFNLPIIQDIALLSEHPALIDAVLANNLQTVTDVLSATQNADVTNHKGYTALHYAVINGHTDLADYLLENGATLIQTNFDGQQAVHFAAMTHNQSMVDALVNHGAAINAVDELGNTPLHYAVMNHGDSNMIQHIIDLGGWVNTANQNGETALHIAAHEGNADVVRVLLDNGADKLLVDHQGETASDEAAHGHFDDIVTMLKNTHNHPAGGPIKLTDVLSLSHNDIAQSDAGTNSVESFASPAQDTFLNVTYPTIPDMIADEIL